MINAYDLRSRIIHGNKKQHVQKVLKSWDLNLNQAADRLEDLLRRTLTAYLNELKTGTDHDEIIRMLDEKVLNDASFSLLNDDYIPDVDILHYIESIGGTPKRVVELLKERHIIEENLDAEDES